MKQVAIRPLSPRETALLNECEETIAAGLTTFIEVGGALLTIHEGRLYRREFATFDEYCTAKWQIGRAYAYRLMEAVRALLTIGDTDLPLPSNEAQARELARVPEEGTGAEPSASPGWRTRWSSAAARTAAAVGCPSLALMAFCQTSTRSGVNVTKDIGDYAGVILRFGEVGLYVYAGRGEVCERIVTGTREVTKEVPDPKALAEVPKVTVTETVEDVEWKCTPLLAVKS